MTARVLVVLLTAVVGCKDPTEAELIVELLRSGRSDDVERGVSRAKRLGTRMRKAGKPSPEAVVVELRRLLASRSSRELREDVVWALQDLAPPGLQPELVACAQGDDVDLARSCIYAIDALGDHANLEGLVEIIADPRRPNCPRDSHAPASHPCWVPVAVGNALRTFGDAVIPHLARVVRDGDTAVRERSLFILSGYSELDAKACAEAALPGLADPGRMARYYAVLAVARDPDRVEALRPLIDDPVPGVRAEARRALGLPFDPRQVESR